MYCEREPFAGADTRVKRRHVIYVQGYDPRGLAQYYRMFRTELRKFAALYEVTSQISKPVSDAQNAMASWTIDTQASNAQNDGWATHTRYDFLRWEDLIKDDLQWPIWRVIVNAFAIYVPLITSGALTKIRKAHWRFAAFLCYPEFTASVEAVLSLLAAFLFGKSLQSVGIPSPWPVIAAAVFFIAAFGSVLKLLEGRTYVLYLMSDKIFTWQFAHRKRPQWDKRIRHFSRYLADLVKTSDADEIVIVGHSSGSFLSIEILAGALQIDPDLGRHAPRIVLLTVGGNIPIVGFLPVSETFRNHLRTLATEPSIDWIDCQSRKDVMNFYPFDPIAGHGIDVGEARRNPTIVKVRFRDIIAPDHYKTFRKRFFRIHFQFVMANEQPNAYDFFMIVCGPLGLRERVDDPASALAIAIGEKPFLGNAPEKPRPSSLEVAPS